ncbi:helix-turn-helix transcriptional regulator [Bacillus cereus]|uniref:helix-turn-helix domain-containing protein n=1 Tax=Bacillus thuringiensis TaxID=1428 RepID=UPI000446C3DB|nr:helix-turn-helix transcriptional regulator [Bacillus thuringiensis]MEB8634123.1 helix-turn-helix transcriptional regulator [Bacillus cereus]EXY06164.1 Cro/Cl family transcriptional regulator [Bacillus thuringiensis]MEB8744029.1 helix-turn-helix transcriptional regulator [Bacillus cereus]MEB8755772.1 helix-turn-helix transcriptional regulator [Bacillus cereus]MEB8798025.1 helix-turn-helix transcriptional regulator [Bacillus cereus]
MTIVDRIKKLCTEQKITIAELERRIQLSNGQIRKWSNQTPGIDKIQKVADYFKVSTDYLIGRTKREYWELTEKDEKDIQKKLEELIEDMSNADALAFSKDSEPMSEETKQLLIISLENSLRLGKQMAKKKFTPKKYRNEE